MDSRSIIAFVLMFLIYFYFLSPKPHPHQDVATNTVTSQAQKSVEESKMPKSTAHQKAQPSENQALAAKKFTLSNKLVQLQINGLGAVESAQFANYREHTDSKDLASFTFSAQPFNESRLNIKGQQPTWKLVEQNESHLRLVSQVDGTVLSRTVTLPENSYVLSIKDEIQNQTPQTVKADLTIQLFYPAPTDQASTSFFKRIFSPQAAVHELVYSQDGSVKRTFLQKVSDEKKSGLFSWSGYDEKYFFFGAIPQNASITDLAVQKHTDGAGYFEQQLTLAEKDIAPRDKSDYEYQFYIGPKEIPHLEKAAPDLNKVVNYGDWLGPIARLLLKIMDFFYSLIPNWGVAIILLTILVKGVLYPLAFKSAISMRKMQMIQPKMKELRDRYKDDKARLNSEMMALYKTEKVNPVGGCFPMLIQMPVFFALYRVFYSSIELRQAPFLWIRDLSLHDPIFVIPVVMTICMWIQQKLTPTPPPAGDGEAAQVQQAMMKWMPMLFGVFTVFLPAGLSLYILINVWLSIVQQIYLNKHMNLRYPLQKTLHRAGA